MCDTLNPNAPAGSMGPIKFPENGNPGSGDVIARPKRKKTRVYKQMPGHAIMSFEEFIKSGDGGKPSTEKQD